MRRELFWGLALFAGLGLLFRFTEIDLEAARLFYSPENPHWPGQTTPPWSWLYRFGEYPAALSAGFGALACLWSFADKSKKSWRGPGLFLFLLYLLGPGLLVNGLGKNLAGRPRPSEIVEFGGIWEFRHAFEFGIPGRGKSFISGHASIAFYWFALYFIVPQSKRYWAFFMALTFGLLMSIARMSQGGHFLSDNLLCGTLMFSLAAGLSPLIKNPGRMRPAWPMLPALAGLILISNPIYEERHLKWFHASQDPGALTATDRAYSWGQETATDPSAYDLQMEVQGGTIHVDFNGVPKGQSGLLWVEERFSSWALPTVKERFEPEALISSPGWPLAAGDIGISLIQRVSGPFWGPKGAFLAHLPAEKPCELRLKSKLGGITIGTLPKDAQVLIYGNFPASALPSGFESYGMNGFRKAGKGPLIALHLEAPEINFDR